MEAKKLIDPSTKYYFNKITGDDLMELLSLAVEKSVEIVAWLKGQEKDIQIYYPIKLDKNQNKLYLDYTPALMKPKKSNFINHNIFLKMNMEKYYLFGHGKLIYENEAYFISTSSVFYKSQQRENIRVEASPILKIKMEIKLGEEIFNLKDMSASGASIFIPPEKASEFEIGKKISKIIFQLENESFKVPKAEVVKEIEGPPSDLKCMAIKFLDILPSEETRLVIKLTTLKRKMDILKSKKK